LTVEVAYQQLYCVEGQVNRNKFGILNLNSCTHPPWDFNQCVLLSKCELLLLKRETIILSQVVVRLIGMLDGKSCSGDIIHNKIVRGNSINSLKTTDDPLSS
jgi:hypothetical protein